MKTKPLAAAALLFAATLATGQAHYLWITIDPAEGELGAADLVFEGGIRPGDGKYMDRFIARGKTWIRTQKSPEYRELSMTDTRKDKLRWLRGALDAGSPRALESYGRFGVWRYGETDVQLHYNAKHVDSSAAEVLAQLGRSEKLELDIVPSWSDGGKMQVQVLWRGKPAVGAKVKVSGAVKVTLETDEKGMANPTQELTGLVQFHTSVDETKSGKDPADGKEFTLVRHHSTLTLTLNLSQP